LAKYKKSNLPEAINKLNKQLKEQWLGLYETMIGQKKSDDEAEKIATNSIRQSLQDNIESLYYMGEFKLGEDNKLEMMRNGNWQHPLYGELKITEKDIDGFITSFNDNVRGVDLAIDLEHGATDKKGAAAGWIKGLEKVKDNDGISLMGSIEWTELGKEAIEKGEYKYFSPEFKSSYKDNESGKIFNNVLFGGGLTNRPFIKNMDPVLLSENVRKDIVENLDNSYKKFEEVGGVKKMNKDLLKTLKLSESASEEEVGKAINSLIEDNEKLITKLSESEVKNVADIKKLSETNEALKSENGILKGTKSTLEIDNIKLSERVVNIESKLNNAEWDKIVTKALSEGKLVPAMVEKYKSLFDKDKQMAIDLMATQPIIVALDELGTKRAKAEGDGDAIALFEKEVAKIMLERKVEYGEALVFAEKEHPKMFEDVEKVRFG